MTAEPMHGDDPMQRSGARWCEDHELWECSKQRSKGRGQCHGPAVRGLDRCRMHLGRGMDLAKTQGEDNLAIWSAQAASGLAVVDPADAVMAQLRVAVYRADLYGELLRLQVADEEVGGIVGATYAAGRDGVRVETGESARGLAKLEAEWRDRVVRYSEVAHRMGIATRAIELAQGQAAIVSAGLRAAIEAAGPDLLPATRGRMVAAFLDIVEGRQGPAGVPVLEGGGV